MDAKTLLIGAALLGGVASSANAGTIPYPNPGTENPETYSFTATANGDVIGYFSSKGGAFLDNQVELLINGTASPNGFGLDNQSSNVGDSFNFGTVHAGDVLTFEDQNNAPHTFFSDKSLNSDGAQHVYATLVTANQAGSGVPAGVYIGFEDSPAGFTDFNYLDEAFVVTDVSVTATPLPSTWTMLIAGFLGLGAFAYRGTRKMSAGLAAT